MDKLELPKHLILSKCIEWDFQYDKFNILYLIIKHIFPETASIKNFREIPEEYLTRFSLITSSYKSKSEIISVLYFFCT